MKIFFRTTRFRVYFTLFLIVIVIPLLLVYSIKQGDDVFISVVDYSEDQLVKIPPEHQKERFTYLAIGDFDVDWTRDSVDVNIEFTNESYIYHLKDIVFYLDFYDDQEAGQVIDSVEFKIDAIAPGETYLFSETLTRRENYLSVMMDLEALSLSLDN